MRSLNCRCGEERLHGRPGTAGVFASGFCQIRASHPTIAEFVLDRFSLEYHETIMAAAGKAAEQSLDRILEQHKGQYIVIVEGSIPLKAVRYDNKQMEVGDLTGTGPAATAHDLGLSQLLTLLRLMDHEPSDVALLGIQPASLAPGTMLSNAVQRTFPELIKAAILILSNGSEAGQSHRNVGSGLVV